MAVTLVDLSAIPSLFNRSGRASIINALPEYGLPEVSHGLALKNLEQDVCQQISVVSDYK
jgi:hypothetical protein